MSAAKETTPRSRPSPEQPRWPMVGRLVLEAHLVLAAGWWWMMPGGFPAGHPRFWVNQVLPWLLLLAAGVGLFSSLKRRWRILQAVLVGLAAMWTAALLAAVILFPISAPRFLAAAFVPVLALLGICVFTLQLRPLRLVPTTITLLIAIAVGIALPYSQRGRRPSTQPVGGRLPSIGIQGNPESVASHHKLGDSISVSRSSGVVDVDCGRLQIRIEPLLTFDSRSPDRCWTIFAPVSKRRRIPRVLTASEVTEEQVRLDFGGQEFLDVTATQPPGSLCLEAFTRLDEPVYSHLNSFCELSIVGHERLSISFSPCPKARIEFRPADYPTGRPLQAAYVDRERGFHIVRAATGEKGPFTTFASGRLARGDPLTITLFDDDRPVCRIALDDWAAQASTALSPTAGWGFPENAIEFRLSDDSPSSPASVWITLAGTSVGRGWDTVGHAAGTYRNRMRVETCEGTDESED